MCANQGRIEVVYVGCCTTINKIPPLQGLSLTISRSSAVMSWFSATPRLMMPSGLDWTSNLSEFALITPSSITFDPVRFSAARNDRFCRVIFEDLLTKGRLICIKEPWNASVWLFLWLVKRKSVGAEEGWEEEVEEEEEEEVCCGVWDEKEAKKKRKKEKNTRYLTYFLFESMHSGHLAFAFSRSRKTKGDKKKKRCPFQGEASVNCFLP
jgi:hypothetical protein